MIASNGWDPDFLSSDDDADGGESGDSDADMEKEKGVMVSFFRNFNLVKHGNTLFRAPIF